jgi:very-short-patch-repair endonuclease
MTAQPHILGARIKTVKKARRLRKEMSLPEVLLWRELKQRPGDFKFRKQFPQDRYVIDFACLEVRLGIEVDGEAHDRGDRPQRDLARDARLRELGFTMARIPAREVLGNLEGVLSGIVERCRALAPSTTGLRPAVPLPVPGRI